MTIKNNLPPTQQTEFGVYSISKRYIDYMRQKEPAIFDPEKTNLYCGPVFQQKTPRGLVEFFVPIDIETYKQAKGFLMNFRDGVYADLFDFKRMLPCLRADRTLYTDMPKLTELCILERTMLEDCATFVLTGVIRKP